MPLLPRRFERLKAVLNQRMGDLTVVLEHVDKPHNLSAILRSCDAVGVLEAHVVSLKGRPRTFNSTAQGSQKWVPLRPHERVEEVLGQLKQQGFRLYGTQLGTNAVDYRQCDFRGPTAFLLGAEKWGLSEAAAAMVERGRRPMTRSPWIASQEMYPEGSPRRRSRWRSGTRSVS